MYLHLCMTTTTLVGDLRVHKKARSLPTVVCFSFEKHIRTFSFCSARRVRPVCARVATQHSEISTKRFLFFSTRPPSAPIVSLSGGFFFLLLFHCGSRSATRPLLILTIQWDPRNSGPVKPADTCAVGVSSADYKFQAIVFRDL